MTRAEYNAEMNKLCKSYTRREWCSWMLAKEALAIDYITSLESELAQAQADNRSLVEQINIMAEKPKEN